MAREIYLDNAATTRPLPDVVEAMHAVLVETYGNPSSLHGKGFQAERAVRAAREAVAALLRVKPAEILFTSGATEANNLAIKGVARAYASRGRHVVTTAIEHSSVLEPCRALERDGFTLTVVPVDREGVVDPEAIARAITPETILVSVMAVNNEVGSVQPLAKITSRVSAARRRPNGPPFLHVDAVQAAGKIPVHPHRAGIDLLSLSAHKFGGPKGAGVLFVREGVRLEAALHGGEQERHLRPGTENVPGIVGLGVAAQVAAADMEENAARIRALRMRLIEKIAALPDVRINGPADDRVAPHILNLRVPGVRGETLVHRLEQDGIYVSTGSACHSRKAVPSHVLLAMGLSAEEALSSIRISLGVSTTEDEIDVAAEALARAIAELRPLAPRPARS